MVVQVVVSSAGIKPVLGTIHITLSNWILVDVVQFLKEKSRLSTAIGWLPVFLTLDEFPLPAMRATTEKYLVSFRRAIDSNVSEILREVNLL